METRRKLGLLYALLYCHRMLISEQSLTRNSRRRLELLNSVLILNYYMLAEKLFNINNFQHCEGTGDYESGF